MVKSGFFRLDENAKRLQESCKGILMQTFATRKSFREAVIKAVKNLHERFVPPYGSASFFVYSSSLIGIQSAPGV